MALLECQATSWVSDGLPAGGASAASRSRTARCSHRSASLNQFQLAVRHEVVPAIHADLGGEGSPIVVAGASIGAFNAVGGRDYARVDVMVRENSEPVVLEVNTLPGMTETSLLPKAAAAAGIDYASLCQRMVDLVMRRLKR